MKLDAMLAKILVLVGIALILMPCEYLLNHSNDKNQNILKT